MKFAAVVIASLTLAASLGHAQEIAPLPDASPPAQSGQSAPSALQVQPQDHAAAADAANQAVPASQQQPKRILGIMPNFRAVSAGAMPPPPTPKQAFVIATRNSFDYSSFAFVGITSLLAEASDAHPALGKGVVGDALQQAKPAGEVA